MAQPDLQIARLWAYLREVPKSLPRFHLAFSAAAIFFAVLLLPDFNLPQRRRCLLF